LYNNKLSGTIPSSIGGLQDNLFYLDFSFNGLEGNLPLEFFDLKLLTGLFLSYNNLSGSIPEDLGDLNKLTDLWLDNNDISGPIPTALGKLRELGKISK